LTLFGGLYTEANAESLPDGASPLTINCDYDLGKVFQRPGKESAFVYNTFYLLNPAFTQSIGTGAPWSIGSVSLNGTPIPPPSRISSPFFTQISASGSTIVYQANFELQNIAGPVVVVLPVNTKGVNPSPGAGGAWVSSISDSISGGGWTQVTPPTQWEVSPPSASTQSSYQFFTKVFPTGFPASWTITFTYNIGDVTTQLSSDSGPEHGGYFQYCSAVDQYQFLKANSTGPSVTAPSITTTQPAVVFACSNIANPSVVSPSGSVAYANDNSTPGLVLATFGPPLTQPAGTFNGTWNYGGIVSPFPDTVMSVVSMIPASGGSGFPISQVLQSLNFGAPIPANSANPPLTATACGCGCTASGQLPVFGLEVLITGSQTNLSPDAVITVQLQLPDGTLSPTTFTIQLPSSTGTVIVGSPTDMWGLALSASLINDPNFTVNLVASTTNGETVTFTASVQLKVFTTPNPPPDIDYLKTFAQTDGDVFSLALGSDGVMYQEDVINNEGVFSPVYTAIEPDSFAQSCTVDDREFIAISNLLNGTDIPYTYNGTNFDRLSQVGPGAPPSASSTTTAATIVSITQAPPTQIRRIVWGASANAINDSTPGNVLVIYGEGRTSDIFATLPNAVAGGTIVLSGLPPNFPLKGGGTIPFNLNGTYTIISVTTAIVGGNETVPVFTVQAPAVEYGYSSDFGSGGTPTSGWFYQATKATMTTAAQVPNLEVGDQFQISGTGGAPTAGYDGTWTVIDTPNASQLQITSTRLLGNIATYGFNLITGTAPTVGESVTVVQTLNGNGIFNISNVAIQSTSPGIFSVNLTGPDTPSAAETGSGIIFGTIFTFDPLQLVGTRNSGNLITIGIISAGVRKICYSFLTRNGYMTAPSPILTVDIPAGASTLSINNLASGPDDVIARVVHLTAANGGNFYNIPIPVTVLDNGVSVVNSSTYLNDNTSRTINLSFSDGVLLAANAIDIQGNNLFATLELGSILGIIGYASRTFAIGEQNKVPNFINWSFDGGYIDASLLPTTIPLGWTRNSAFGAGGILVNSPIFGFAYQIQNATGSTQATYGMITQPAFQDEFLVPIIRPSTKYSTRITAAVTAGGASGNLVVDLFSPSLALSLGNFSVPLASIGTRMQIFTGAMLTNVLAPVPNDLLLRIYATAIPDGTTIVIDRNEPFPTEQPNLSTQVTGSYVNNFEAFDESGEGGIVDTAGENQQAVRSAFTLYDTLYLVKTGSFVSTQDNGSTEPSGWSLRIVSNSVGTPSIYGVTTGIDEPNTGEAWAIIAGQPGGYIFNGGEPIKITEEIQSLWNYINWAYGHTLWVKNDVKNRRIYFAVPLKTPNPWLPTGIIPDDSNPTTPNVILMLNYKQLNTGSTLAEKVGVHVSYSGRLIASELTRKWSIWTIKAPCAAFLQRADTTEPLFLGNSDDNGKIFQLDEAHTMCGQDDCSAMIQIYDTYGFVTDEQGQGLRLGSTRKLYAYMMMMVRGSGNMNLAVFPNTLDSQYAHDLLPRIPLPQMTDGDIEVPVNETANRLFVQFRTDEIGSCFELSRLMMAMGIDPWSPVRGT